MDALDLSRELLRFDTINPPGEEHACVLHLARRLEAAGFATRAYEYARGRTSLVARLGNGSAPPLAFAGHVDTVPLGGAPWTRDPFAGEVAEGRLYGRGTSDMKCGVAAFVAAAIRSANRLGATPGVVLAIVAGEGTGCEGSRHLASTPGALGEAGAMVVAEPTANSPCIGHKGALWLDAQTSGVTAHGSMPEQGDNAIYKAARAITRLERFEFDGTFHPVLGRPTVNVGTIAGGLNINSVPDRATFTVDIRTVPGMKHDALLNRLRRQLGDEVQLKPMIDLESVWTDPADPWIQQVIELAAPIVGTRAASAAPYYTDAAALTAGFGGIPTVILGPGEMEMAHKTDEYCRVDRLEQAVELYSEIAERWCGL